MAAAKAPNGRRARPADGPPGEQDPGPAPSPPPPRRYSLTEDDLVAIGKTAARSALGRVGADVRWGRGDAEIPIPATLGGPVVVDPSAIADRAGSAGALYLLKRSLEGVPTSDPRDERLRQLEQQLAAVQQEKAIANAVAPIAQEVSALRTALAHFAQDGGGKENGKSLEGELLAKILSTLVDKALSPVDPLAAAQQGVEVAKTFASMYQPNQAAIDLKKVDASLAMWQQSRSDKVALEQARIQAEAATVKANQAQLHDMITLGTSALKDAISPVTNALGEGVRGWTAAKMGAAPATSGTGGNPPPMPRPDDVRPEDRVAIAARLEASVRRASEFVARLHELEERDRRPAPKPVPEVPREEQPYGDIVEHES